MSVFKKVKMSMSTMMRIHSLISVYGVIKTNEADYIPAFVELRTRISPYIITCEIPTQLLVQLDEDDRIAAAEISVR